MAAWSVAETVRFLEAADLHGPAHLCQHNRFNGMDLLGVTESSLVADLRCTPFAARKIVGARENFLKE